MPKDPAKSANAVSNKIKEKLRKSLSKASAKSANAISNKDIETLKKSLKKKAKSKVTRTF